MNGSTAAGTTVHTKLPLTLHITQKAPGLNCLKGAGPPLIVSSECLHAPMMKHGVSRVSGRELSETMLDMVQSSTGLLHWVRRPFEYIVMSPPSPNLIYCWSQWLQNVCLEYKQHVKVHSVH